MVNIISLYLPADDLNRTSRSDFLHERTSDIDLDASDKMDELERTGIIGLSLQPWRLELRTGGKSGRQKNYCIGRPGSAFEARREHGSRNSMADRPCLPFVFRPGRLRKQNEENADQRDSARRVACGRC
jgi:hypothetical protein